MSYRYPQLTLVREVGSQLITQFVTPYKGTWNSVSANMILPDTLYESMNVFIREGKLRERPGLSLLNSTVFDSPVIGGAMAVSPNGKRLLSFTKTTIYELGPSDLTWTAAAVSMASDDNPLAEVAFLETSSDYVGLIAVEDVPLKRWIYGSGVTTVPSLEGEVPKAKSVCIAGRRVVCLVPPHTIQWTPVFDYQRFPVLSRYKIAQTNDLGICVRSLGSLSFVLYKERSLYLARAQAGSDAQAFSFSEPLEIEGPSGPHAVLRTPRGLLHFTSNGRIALFDGSGFPQWIADGLWLFLQGDIDPSFVYKTFGVFDYRLHTATFYYPRIGDSGLLKGMVLINFPYEGSGIENFTSFLGVSAKPVSYGYESRFNQSIDRSLLFTSTSGDCQSFYQDEGVRTDDGSSFNCSFQTGLFPLPEMRHYQISLESYLERAVGNGSVKIYPLTSDILENKSGLLDENTYVTINLNSNPVKEFVGFNIPTRFFGLKYSWLSTTGRVRYGGASVYGRPVGT